MFLSLVALPIIHRTASSAVVDFLYDAVELCKVCKALNFSLLVSVLLMPTYMSLTVM